ncbi:hypothetical protein G7085_12580 [Tessaracoccus sp. HDW20]|uniref:hypothetical protein n=1 Tax=Tessaracoccus coleopterorum TaxID=2714950 RepID=UPI0018D4A388|nr:hypothetical protein [Tessaracoccus coleopterorum]NHB85176.1 hypothetical protein [Tessaracoccus coleopterorum]
MTRAAGSAAPSPSGHGGAYSALVDGGFTGKATLLVRTPGEPQVSRTVDLLPATLSQAVPATIDPLAGTTIKGALSRP